MFHWGHAVPKHQDKVRPNSATMFYGKSNALRISANIFVLATSDSSFLLLLNSHYSASWGCFFTSDLASNQIWEHFLFLYSMSSLSSYCSQEAAVTTRHALRFGVTQRREGAYTVQITWNWILDLSDRIKFFSYFFSKSGSSPWLPSSLPSLYLIFCPQQHKLSHFNMQNNTALCNLEYIFSWYMFCVHLKRMNILLMLSWMLYKCQLDQVWVLFKSSMFSLSFCLLVLSVTERGIVKCLTEMLDFFLFAVASVFALCILKLCC